MQSLAAIPQFVNSSSTDPRARWIAAHQGAIWRYLRYLGADAALAEDALQDAFLAGLRHRIYLRSEAQSRTWLRTTARNLLTDRARKLRRRGELLSGDLAEAVWQEEEGSGRRQALRECLATLGARSRRALELRYGEGLGRGALGEALGMAPEGVKSLLQRLRAALRVCIEQRCPRDE